MPNNVLVSFYDDVKGPRNELLLGYFKEGRLPYEYSGTLDISVEEFSSILEDEFGVRFSLDKTIYSVRGSGGMILEATPSEDKLKVELSSVLDGCIASNLQMMLEAHTYRKSLEEGVHNVHVRTYFLDKSGNMQYTYINKETSDFDYVAEYMYPKINVKMMAEMYNDSDESNLILSGAPGTGKTCMAKLLLKALAIHCDCDIDVIYVKDVGVLKSAEFWSQATLFDPEMMILDDLDDELRPRTEGRNDIINQMLSFSDGIFDVHTKVVITTNLTDTKIDPALVRPGRCFDVINLPRLTKAEAKVIWTGEFKQSEESFEKRFENFNTISQAMLSSENTRERKAGHVHYLYDQSISVREKVELGEDLNHEDV